MSQLPFSVDADVLKKDFSKFGEISRFFFHQDEEGKPRGTACIFYKDPDVPDKVILLDGIEYKGRNIKAGHGDVFPWICLLPRNCSGAFAFLALS